MMNGVLGLVGFYLLVLLFMAWLSQNTSCPPFFPSSDQCVTVISQNAFWASFYSNFMATVAGIAFGIPAGLYLNRMDWSKKRKTENRENIEKFLTLLTMIDGNVHNISNRMVDIREGLSKGKVPFISVNSTIWKSMSTKLLSELSSFGEDGSRAIIAIDKFYIICDDIESMMHLIITSNVSENNLRESYSEDIARIITLTHGRCSEGLAISKEILDLIIKVRSKAWKVMPSALDVLRD